MLGPTVIHHIAVKSTLGPTVIDHIAVKSTDGPTVIDHMAVKSNRVLGPMSQHFLPSVRSFF